MCTGFLQDDVTSHLQPMPKLSLARSLCCSFHYHLSVYLAAAHNKHEYSVFERPWQRGRQIEPHEQEAVRGQQDVPWLRRRGSKNSRKLLYFVEWAQECKMSAFFFSRSLGLGRITCCRRRALKITGALRDACVRRRAGTRIFAVTHLHILRWRPAGVHRRKRALSPPPPSADTVAVDASWMENLSPENIHDKHKLYGPRWKVVIGESSGEIRPAIKIWCLQSCR